MQCFLITFAHMLSGGGKPGEPPGFYFKILSIVAWETGWYVFRALA